MKKQALFRESAAPADAHHEKNTIARYSYRVIVLLFGFLAAFCSESQAQQQANHMLPLAGLWDFRLDPKDQGIQEKWFDTALTDKIKLPGSTDENGFGKKTTDRSPNWLTRVYTYSGPAWYQKHVLIPADWKGKRITLLLERCHWETQVWVDGQPVGMQNSLCAPHEYDLTALLAPGPHRIAVRVDSRYKINIGKDAHSITEHTQTGWNGMIGRLELAATDPIWIDDVQVTPDIARKTARVRVTIGNQTGQAAEGVLALNAHLTTEDSGGVEKRLECHITGEKQTQVAIELPMGDAVKLWDEFTPNRYKLTVGLTASAAGKKYSDNKQASFGMCEFRTRGTQFTVNGRLTFLRGTLECCVFPLTAYPPTDPESWQRIIRVAKAHGLNHFRFHSWCPPEAAFEAADREGFYLHVETPVWATLGSDAGCDAFVYAEGDRILRAYGNHPSFTMLCVGNEPSGRNHEAWLSKIVRYWKQKDPRRLYTSCSGWPVTPESDYHSRPNPRIQGWGEGLRSRVNALPLSTDMDYRGEVAHFRAPVVSHEIGQWCVFPNLREIDKYTGVVRARNFEIVRDSLREHHMLDQAQDFVMASGKLQTLLYKEEIEAALRTAGFGGFQLLDLHDFPGQGTALVGVLDPFWDSKDYVTAAEFRQFCSPTVPLLRMKKCVWTNAETFTAQAEIAHYGAAPIQAATPVWSLAATDGRVVASGELPALPIPLGGGTALGKIDIPLAKVDVAKKLILTLSLKDTPYTNHWDVWVYPAQVDRAPPTNVLVASSLDTQTTAALAAGRKVLLLLPPAAVRSDVPPGFSPIFWNTRWTRRQPPHTLGILCDPKHAAWATFPTEFHSNWQWWDPVSKSRAMILDGFPPDFRPLIQVIDDWNTNRRLGLVFEAKTGGGKLLGCSIDLSTGINQRPVSRQMLRSLLDYMGGDTFAPSKELPIELVRGLMK
ncbi:MAG: sugar-binding domain-containing protein [Planctomycetota bacterium]